MKLKGSKTEKNLYRTFAGESRARSKYNLYAEKAREEGYEWIAEIFDITAMNEFAHARRVYRDFLKLVCDTNENLIDAICGEEAEYKDLYARFEQEAREEGFTEIADLYKEIREVEEAHEKRFKELYDRLISGKMFNGLKDSKWVCMNCGYIHEGSKAPEKCALCAYPRSYFKPYCEIKDL